MADIRAHLIIEGRVQGVWFRESTRLEAVSLGVFGWVRNLPDGTVEIMAAGPKEAAKGLASWGRHGPPVARVDHVHEKYQEWQGEFQSFEIVF